MPVRVRSDTTAVYRRNNKPKNNLEQPMKTIKMLTLAAFVAAVSCTGVFASEGCGDKKDHKCCTEAKAAGKTCEKCAPKSDKK